MRDGSRRRVDRLVCREMPWAPLRYQFKDAFIGCFARGDVPSCGLHAITQPS